MPRAVTVVIPCRNEARTVARLLDALEAQRTPPDSVVVVDDRSSDGTASIVRSWAATHLRFPVALIEGEGRGTGAAMNAGVKAARGDLIVRLDGHCEPAPDYIQRSLETLTSNPSAGVVGGVWRIEPGSRTLTARGIAAVLSHPFGSGGATYRVHPKAGDVREPFEADTVPFGTFRKSLWQEIGGFDESLLRNQDYDFNYRVRLAGYAVILNPAILSRYTARPTLVALGRQYFAYGFWKVVMLRKFPASIRARQAVPLALVPLLAACVVWAVLGRSGVPVWILLAYAAINVAGGLHAALRARDPGAAPFGAAALIVLQIAWSLGALSSARRLWR